MHRWRLAIIFCTFKVIPSNLRQILPRFDIPPCFFSFETSIYSNDITRVLYYALQLPSAWSLQPLENFILNPIQFSFQNSSVLYTHVVVSMHLYTVQTMHKLILPTVHKLSPKSSTVQSARWVWRRIDIKLILCKARNKFAGSRSL